MFFIISPHSHEPRPKATTTFEQNHPQKPPDGSNDFSLSLSFSDIYDMAWRVLCVVAASHTSQRKVRRKCHKLFLMDIMRLLESFILIDVVVAVASLYYYMNKHTKP